MKKRQRPVVGTTIHIGKPFESYDGVILKNRFMCVFSVENDNLILIPMSTFHSKEKRDKKIKMLVNFEYSQKHGNNRDGYLKCNQFYFLNKKEYDNFKELYVSRTMNQKRFLRKELFLKIHLLSSKKTQILKVFLLVMN